MILAILAVVGAVLGIVVEAKLLADMIRVFGEKDPSMRYISAGVIVIVCSGVVEIVHRLVMRTDDSGQIAPWKQRASVALKIAGLVAMITLLPVLGLLRAEDLMFGAKDGATYDGFISRNPTLTRIGLALLTIVVPIVVGAYLSWGLGRLSIAWDRWNRHRITHRLAIVESIRQQWITRCEQDVEALDNRCQAQVRWASGYYEHGRRSDKKYPDFWRRVFMSVGFVLLAIASCIILDRLLIGLFPSVELRLFLWGVLITGLGALSTSREFKLPPPSGGVPTEETRLVTGTRKSNGSAHDTAQWRSEL